MEKSCRDVVVAEETSELQKRGVVQDCWRADLACRTCVPESRNLQNSSGTPSDTGLVYSEKCLFASWVSSVTQTPGGPAYTATCQTENHWRHTCKRKHLCQQVSIAVLHNTSQKAWKEKFYLTGEIHLVSLHFSRLNIDSLSLLHL